MQALADHVQYWYKSLYFLNFLINNEHRIKIKNIAYDDECDKTFQNNWNQRMFFMQLSYAAVNTDFVSALHADFNLVCLFILVMTIFAIASNQLGVWISCRIYVLKSSSRHAYMKKNATIEVRNLT